MQDEVNEKVVSLAIKTSKLTAEVLQKAMKALLAKGKGQITKAPHVILSRLVDTFISKISLTMLPVPKPHNTACVLSWEEARRWQSRSSGYSSS